MSFAENLKQIRKEKNISQEKLAELLDVSRQAVSKWEQGIGYPEVEKLLLLSKELDISLDSLMEKEIAKGENPETGNVTGSIVIESPNENIVMTCCKVMSSPQFKGGKKSPKYALIGVQSNGGSSFCGENTTFLGWYASQESIANEIRSIYEAIAKGIPAHSLKYSVKVEKHLFSVKIK